MSEKIKIPALGIFRMMDGFLSTVCGSPTPYQIISFKTIKPELTDRNPVGSTSLGILLLKSYGQLEGTDDVSGLTGFVSDKVKEFGARPVNSEWKFVPAGSKETPVNY
ncbi:MAG: hypothetical protein AAB788_01620, partial [Patescibacteria group bacterium]